MLRHGNPDQTLRGARVPLPPELPREAYMIQVTPRRIPCRPSHLSVAARLAAFFALLSLVAIASGCGSTLVKLNDSVAFASDQIGNAREAGLVTPEEVERNRPVFDAIDAALDEAGEAQRAGDTKGYETARRAVLAGMAKLRPLLEKAKGAPKVRPSTRPATL